MVTVPTEHGDPRPKLRYEKTDSNDRENDRNHVETKGSEQPSFFDAVPATPATSR